MPSRLGIALIVGFWLATMGTVAKREIQARYFADAPPRVSIEVVDEATPSLPVHWAIYRGDKAIGSLTTTMTHLPEDDSFRFTSKYRNISLDFGGEYQVYVPRADVVVRVHREGRLLEQSMSGEGQFQRGELVIFEGQGSVQGRVEQGRYVGTCEGKTNWGHFFVNLQPVPIREGQALNPLMPLSRLKDVRPGKRWTIRRVDPLRDSFKLMLFEWLKSKNLGSLLPPERPDDEEFRAEVKARPETADRAAVFGGPVECWVIEYRGGQARVETWVAVKDGRVIRQDARLDRDMLRFERKD